MVEDTYTRSGCVVILKYGGVVQWQKIAITKGKDGAFGASEEAKMGIYQNEMRRASEIWWSGVMVEDSYTRSGCVVILTYGGVVHGQKILGVVVL